MAAHPQGDWLVFESPDKTAVVGFLGVYYYRTEHGAQRTYFQGEPLGISDHVWEPNSHRAAEVGPDHLDATVEQGGCILSSRHASFTVHAVTPPRPAGGHLATAWPDSEKRALVVRVLGDDATALVRLEADAAADSLRRKR